ncbi:hypothetical protein V6N13_040292 [Hibiscus sabdariffa]
MLQHSGAQNRQKCRKDKAARYFAAYMVCHAGIVPHVKGIFPYSIRAQNPRTPPIKGTLKELKGEGGELGRKRKKEKVKRGDLRERKLAAASSSTSRNHHCRAPSKGFAASREGHQA